MKSLAKLKKIKGDASFREFYRNGENKLDLKDYDLYFLFWGRGYLKHSLYSPCDSIPLMCISNVSKLKHILRPMRLKASKTPPNVFKSHFLGLETQNSSS